MRDIQYPVLIEAIKFRSEMALKLPQGRGIEWGALYWPTPLSDKHKVFYGDFKDISESELAYAGMLPDKIHSTGLVKPDFVCSFPEVIEHAPLDFFIAHHVLEHFECVVSFLEIIEKSLRVGGETIITVPDSDKTFDNIRNDSRFSDVVFAWNNPEEFKHAKIYEHLILVENTPIELVENKTDEIYEKRLDPHLWVFRKYTFYTLITDILREFKINMEIVEHVYNQHFNEISLRLRKTK